ncbi:hypothetical protein QQY24_13090 [Streptomyces sp. TG1A-8]|uniref:hypothetical protein n=1 Tax=Streptomyces sp. TG1A-8 TaxID=3051385 RepID=UPI00265C49D2|nr:hypothetical protein [Streptomyces sp. TG1A-8]MDO0926312.1 hypothetical protein [Streptomyces sp. TG1A-8]
MSRRTLALITATTTATLLLTACGGGGGRTDDIEGADTAPDASPSVSASGSAAPSGASRPDITLPSSFRLTFENWTSSDPVKQAVLNDAREELRAGYAAIIANKPDGGEELAFYDTETGLAQSQKWIRSYTDKNVTVIGKLPAFAAKVVLANNGRAASLSYCTDESEAYTRNRKTNKVEGNPAGTDPYVLYVVSLAKGAQGVWRNSSVQAKRGGCSK